MNIGIGVVSASAISESIATESLSAPSPGAVLLLLVQAIITPAMHIAIINSFFIRSISFGQDLHHDL
jgi:hypothetical protein